jgi:hypothetical protein
MAFGKTHTIPDPPEVGPTRGSRIADGVSTRLLSSEQAERIRASTEHKREVAVVG